MKKICSIVLPASWLCCGSKFEIVTVFSTVGFSPSRLQTSLDCSRVEDEHRLIARYASRLAADSTNAVSLFRFLKYRSKPFWEEKLGGYAMKRVSAGAHLPTPRLFEPGKRPDNYCLNCSFLPQCKSVYSFLHLSGVGHALGANSGEGSPQ